MGSRKTCDEQTPCAGKGEDIAHEISAEGGMHLNVIQLLMPNDYLSIQQIHYLSQGHILLRTRSPVGIIHYTALSTLFSCVG